MLQKAIFIMKIVFFIFLFIDMADKNKTIGLVSKNIVVLKNT